MQQDSETRSEGPAVGSDADSEANADAAPPVVGGHEEESEQRPASQKVSGLPAPVSLMARFALPWPAVVIIGIVAVLVWYGVWKRGSEPSGGLLGRALRVGIVPWPGYAGGLVANHGLKPNKDSAFWKGKKDVFKGDLFVEFVIINDDAQLRRDFARGGGSGGIDVMWSTVDSLSLAQQSPEFLKGDVHPRAFLQVDWSRGADAIIASADIHQIEDLKGKKVAVSMPASQWLLEYSLVNSSLTEAERTQIRQSLRVKTSGSKEALDLFLSNKSNKVDAAVLWEPDIEDATSEHSEHRRPGAHILYDTSKATNLIADVMVAKEEFIKEHPDVIKTFIQGWMEGTREAVDDPMQAVKVLMDEPDLGFSNLTEQEVRELLGKTALATLDDNVDMFGLSGKDVFFDQLFNRAGRLWMKDGYVTSRVEAAQARDTLILKEIYDAEPKTSAARADCDQSLPTVELPITFPPNKADLSPAAQRGFDDKDIPLLLRTNAQFRFCIEAGANDGDNPQLAPGTKRAREDAVIKYLVERYDRPHSQFVSASASPSEKAGGAKDTQYIRLKLTGESRQQ